MSKVTVVVPNYNGKKFIKKCLSHLSEQEYKDFRVIVVDNGSEDESFNAVYEYVDEMDVELVKLDSNYGFSRAVNEGIIRSDSEYVILLNNDAYVGKSCIKELVQVMEMDREEKIFSAQALMLQYGEGNKVDSAGDYFCALGWGFSKGKDGNALKYTKVKEVFSSCAGAAIYRMSVFDEIGLFDENFFAYLEDMDIGYRGKLAGYRNVLVPKARVLHVGSGSSGSRHNEFKVRLSSRNSLLVMYKNFSVTQWIINLPLILLGIIIKILFFARKKLAKAYIKGLVSAFFTFKKVKRTKPVSRCYVSKIERELIRNIFLRLIK